MFRLCRRRDSRKKGFDGEAVKIEIINPTSGFPVILEDGEQIETYCMRFIRLEDRDGSQVFIPVSIGEDQRERMEFECDSYEVMEVTMLSDVVRHHMISFRGVKGGARVEDICNNI